MPDLTRTLRVTALVLLPFFAIWGCDCTGSVPDGDTTEECISTDDCAGNQECIEEVCIDVDADAGTDTDASGDADAGDDTDTDTGDNSQPACPDAVTCEDEGVECGTIADGCGQTLYCGGCDPGEICGTGDDKGQCIESDCTPTASCGDADFACGTVPDGCGQALDCGTCGSGEVCAIDNGGRQCVDDSCQPQTCDALSPGECGLHPDGCGGTVHCGGCPQGQTCSDAGGCVDVDCDPLSCDDYDPGECGPHPDGCGNTLDCGSCTGDNICGSGDELGECIEASCDPLTCDDYPDVNCGQVSDGCGGLTQNCGTCQDPEICGGGGLPNVCGADPGDDDGCINLCEDQAVCSAGDATTLTGTVYAPNGQLPLPNATVYVPNDPLDELPEMVDGPVCEQCEDEELGSPLVGTISDEEGNFELDHVPADTEFPLVIKLGQWRRVVTISEQTPCGETALDSEDTRLPTMQGEQSIHDNIPKTAVSTGAIDAMECVFRQIGVDESEFTRHYEDGRIHIYRANGGVVDQELSDACDGTCGVSDCTDRYPYDSGWFSGCGSGNDGDMLRANLSYHLYDSQQALDSYDMVVMDCEGNNYSAYRSSGDFDRLRNYVNAGGRLFASHYAYDWLEGNDELDDPVNWVGSNYPDESDAFIDTSFTGGSLFWDWLVLVDDDFDSGDDAEITITDPRSHAESLDDDMATRWLYTDESAGHYDDAIQQLTFNTPVDAADDAQCGQVAYSAFHVADALPWDGQAFPTYCGSMNMTTQERVLAYMLFNLAACVTEDSEPPAPSCDPLSCDDQGAECGQVSDGCGEVLDCGNCPDGTACGADGIPNICSADCQPLSCDDHDADCGTVDDGCGNTLDCGDCPDGQSCGGDGAANQCGCQPLSCDDHNADCGTVDDGCGNTLDCGDCPDGQVCGGDGIPNICEGDCQALSCNDHDAECGTVDDGCGNTLDCGNCPDPLICGGDGEPNVCGCQPLSCDDHSAECGSVDDGCGNTLDCGNCPGDDASCVDNTCQGPCADIGESCAGATECCQGLICDANDTCQVIP